MVQNNGKGTLHEVAIQDHDNDQEKPHELEWGILSDWNNSVVPLATEQSNYPANTCCKMLLKT